jgi:uncharacterized delta-60 repeat protein
VRRAAGLAAAAAVLAGPGPAAHAADRCSLSHAHVLRQDARARLLVVHAKGAYSSRYYACLRGHVPRRLTSDWLPQDVDASHTNYYFRLAGATVAWVSDERDGSGNGSLAFRVELRTLGGARSAEITTQDTDAGSSDYGPVQALKLAPDGTLAWVVDLAYEDHYQEVDGLPARSRRVVALGYGRGIDPHSLRVTAGRAAWRQRGTRRTAAVVPTAPPLSAAPSGRLVGPQGRDPRFGPCGLARTASAEAAADLPVLALTLGGDVVTAVAIASPAGYDTIRVDRLSPEGMPDESFGSGGTVRTRLPAPGAGRSIRVTITGLVLGPDGSIVVGGLANVRGARPAHARTLLARYDATGRLDPTFGQGGVALGEVPGKSAALTALVLAPDGGLIAAGERSRRGFVARFRADGSLDPAFGDGGVADVPSLPAAVAAAVDGTITTIGADDDAVALTRLSAAGTRLSTTTTHVPGDIAMGGLAPLPDGGYVAVGSFTNFVSGGLLQLRYTAAGALDTAFGRDGVVLDPAVPGATGLVVVPDGGWIVSTYSGLARYAAAGTRDREFGWGGVLAGTGVSYADPVAGPDGTLLTAALGGGAAVARFAIDEPALSATQATQPVCGYFGVQQLVGSRSTTDRVEVGVRVLRPGVLDASARLIIGSRTLPLGTRTRLHSGIGEFQASWPVGRRGQRLLRDARHASVVVTAGPPGGPATTGTIRLKG